MGKSIYYILVAVTILLGMILSQDKKNRKTYVVITAILHALVSGLRYQFLTGDLIRYNTLFQDFNNRFAPDQIFTGLQASAILPQAFPSLPLPVLILIKK